MLELHPLATRYLLRFTIPREDVQDAMDTCWKNIQQAKLPAGHPVRHIQKMTRREAENDITKLYRPVWAEAIRMTAEAKHKSLVMHIDEAVVSRSGDTFSVAAHVMFVPTFSAWPVIEEQAKSRFLKDWEVTDEDVEKEIKERLNRAPTKLVDGKSAGFGDRVMLELVGRGTDGSVRHKTILRLDDSCQREVMDAVVGREPGETILVNFTFGMSAEEFPVQQINFLGVVKECTEAELMTQMGAQSREDMVTRVRGELRSGLEQTVADAFTAWVREKTTSEPLPVQFAEASAVIMYQKLIGKLSKKEALAYLGVESDEEATVKLMGGVAPYAKASVFAYWFCKACPQLELPTDAEAVTEAVNAKHHYGILSMLDLCFRRVVRFFLTNGQEDGKSRVLVPETVARKSGIVLTDAEAV